MQTIDLTSCSSEELEKALKQKRAAEQEQRKKAKKEYEKKRDQSIESAINRAIKVGAAVKFFKDEMHKIFTEQHDDLQKYVGLSAHSKGGFSLVHSNGLFKMTRTLKSQPKWDERADEAVNLMNEFINDKLKRTKHYGIIKALIEKNKAGELSFPMVMKLIELKDEYDDERWQKAMELLIESYGRSYSGYGYDFYVKDAEGKWDKIDINFTSI